jgi:lysophospholipid acyltransferase (LPLAT)-like uncharacterized protein
MVPLPFAKTAYVYGDPIYIPPNCSQEELEQWADKVGLAITDVEEQADGVVGIAPGSQRGAQEASELRRA